MDEVENTITAIGAIIEISRFMYKKMKEEGYSHDEAFKTAQCFILMSLNVGRSNE